MIVVQDYPTPDLYDLHEFLRVAEPFGWLARVVEREFSTRIKNLVSYHRGRVSYTYHAADKLVYRFVRRTGTLVNGPRVYVHPNMTYMRGAE